MMTAKEAAAELGVSLATLYAYVSRGMIRSEPTPGSRARLYVADDIRRLNARKQGGEKPAAPLDWGEPVLESEITLIEDGTLYYRGRDAVRLAEASSLETVAALLWQIGETDPFAEPPPAVDADLRRAVGGLATLPAIDRTAALLPVAAQKDPQALGRTPTGLHRTGARLLRWVTAAVTGMAPGSAPVHEQIGSAWRLSAEGRDLVRRALVLCADHELNASSFAVRVVASTGASPYAAIVAGLAAIGGPLHGGMTERAAEFLSQALAADSAERTAAERLRRGEDLPGFGHRLYPRGDPRARALINWMAGAGPPSPEFLRGRQLVQAVHEMTGEHPTIDFALALLARHLGLGADAPLGLFAVGRTTGWMAHALEQYASGKLIRPRARYTGRQP